MMNLEDIVSHFITGKIISIEENKQGRINESFLVTYQEKQQKKILIQKINTLIFPNVTLLMNNIFNITTFLERKKIPTLKLIPTLDNQFFLYQNGSYYRAFEYIDHTISYDHPTNLEISYEVGLAFGELLSSLNDYPTNSFESVLSDFHNTKKRWNHFLTSYQQDLYHRKKEIEEIFLFLNQKKHYIDTFFELLNKKALPTHLIHGDTKANNVLFHENKKNYLLVLDFDTFYLDTLLWDYGDGIRSIAATKDDTIDMKIFESFTKGFIHGAFQLLTEIEINHFILSVLVITLELSIRYLDDYLSGDTYFKIEQEKDNLIRAKHQLLFFQNVEENQKQLEAKVQEIYQEEQKKHL